MSIFLKNISAGDIPINGLTRFGPGVTDAGDGLHPNAGPEQTLDYGLSFTPQEAYALRKLRDAIVAGDIIFVVNGVDLSAPASLLLFDEGPFMWRNPWRFAQGGLYKTNATLETVAIGAAATWVPITSFPTLTQGKNIGVSMPSNGVLQNDTGEDITVDVEVSFSGAKAGAGVDDFEYSLALDTGGGFTTPYLADVELRLDKESGDAVPVGFTMRVQWPAGAGLAGLVRNLGSADDAQFRYYAIQAKRVF